MTFVSIKTEEGDNRKTKYFAKVFKWI